MPPNITSTSAISKMMVMITAITSRGVTMGLGLRSITMTGFVGATRAISIQRSSHGVAAIRSVPGSSATIAFADLRKSDDGIGITPGVVGAGAWVRTRC